MDYELLMLGHNPYDLMLETHNFRESIIDNLSREGLVALINAIIGEHNNHVRFLHVSLDDIGYVPLYFLFIFIAFSTMMHI